MLAVREGRHLDAGESHDRRVWADQSGTRPVARVFRGLTGRILVASGLLALVVAAAFALLLVALAQQTETARLARHSQLVLATANEFERVVVDLETSVRGYVLTGEDRFLEPWRTARKDLPKVSERLEQLTAGTPRVDEARLLGQGSRAYLDEYSVPLVKQAETDRAAAGTVIATAEGKRRVDALRAIFDRLTTAETDLADRRQAEAAEAARTASTAAAAGLAISVLLIAFFAAYLIRSIVRPLREAAGMADQVAGGDLAARIPDEKGPGEIGSLQRVLNTMGRSLERNRDELGGLVTEQSTLRRLATLVARAESPEVVFAAVVDEVGHLLDADGTTLYRYDTDATATLVAEWGVRDAHVPVGTPLSVAGPNIVAAVHDAGRPARTDDLTRSSGSVAESLQRRGVRSAVAAPIIVDGRLWGALAAVSTREDPLPPDTETHIRDFTDLIVIAVSNAEAQLRLRGQQQEILELSTPVISVWDDVLVLPIIGTLDSTRAARLTEDVLHKLAEARASVIIIDVSGVPTIDLEIGGHLLRTVQAAALMGTVSILSGVRAGVAKSMVDLGVDLGRLQSRTTLRDALQLALHLLRERPGSRAG